MGRNKLKQAVTFKVSQEIATSDPEFLKMGLMYERRRLINSNQEQRGYKAIPPIKEQSGYCNEDFIHNMITYQLSVWVVRAPRICMRRHYKRSRFKNKFVSFSNIVYLHDMNLTTKQSEFIEAVKSGVNIFLSGMAGTGKSTVTKMAFDVVREMGKQFLAVAPTGIAASNIDGATIHSQFAVSPYGVATFETANFMKQMKRDVLARAEVIFIDEVSMVRADLLDAMHWACRKNNVPGLDSKQIVFIGDMGQLRPVVNDTTRAVMLQTYRGVEFYHAKIYGKLNPVKIELDEVVRQSDRAFIDALNVVRGGGKDPYFKQFVHTQPTGVILAPHNATVQEYNTKGLLEQDGQEFIFKGEVVGDMKYSDTTLEPEITVKHGCKIMYLVNSKDAPLRNGTLGEFVVKTEMDSDGETQVTWYAIRVGNIEYELRKYLAVKKEYVYNKYLDTLELREIGSIEQYPFKLAYALSIHKSQGLTLDEVSIDLRRPCFEDGQLYVALSRVRTPEGLKIII